MINIEMKVFNQLSSYVNFLYHSRLIAEIYRPAAETMALASMGKRRAEILAAVEKAGMELVESKSVAKETMEAITQRSGSDRGAFAKTANLMWKTCIAEGVTPKEFREKRMKPRPDSIETFLMIMPMGFNPLHLGVIFLVNLEMGLTTPPVGMNIFVLAGVSEQYGIGYWDIVKGAIPFLLVDLVVLLLCIAFPGLTLWLPGIVR